MILFSYLHEYGHKKELNDAKIPSTIRFHILNNIKKTFREAHPFAMINFDKKEFNRLNKNKKIQILLGGIKVDLIITIILILLILIFYFMSFLSKNTIIFYIGFFWILLLITQVIKFFYNIFSEKSDIGKFKKLIDKGVLD